MKKIIKNGKEFFVMTKKQVQLIIMTKIFTSILQQVENLKRKKSLAERKKKSAALPTKKLPTKTGLIKRKLISCSTSVSNLSDSSKINFKSRYYYESVYYDRTVYHYYV